jgi:hypothetical protein
VVRFDDGCASFAYPLRYQYLRILLDSAEYMLKILLIIPTGILLAFQLTLFHQICSAVESTIYVDLRNFELRIAM